MSVREQLRSYRAVLPQLRKAGRPDLLGWLPRRPQLLAATLAYETG